MFLHSFISPEHLEIDKKNIEKENLQIIKSQIKKINTFKTPKDKLICIINACKLISGMIKHRGFKNSNKEPGADDFLPILIYSVLLARPLNPVSDTVFIRKFRRENEINGMIDYYLTCYESVFDFFEKICWEKLKIEKEDYDSFISEKNREFLIENLEGDRTVVLEEDLVEGLEGCFYGDLKGGLKFEDVSYNSLFVADLEDLFKEYKVVLENYKKMSNFVKGFNNGNSKR